MAALPTVLTVERSHNEAELDAKIERCNMAREAQNAPKPDPWAKFRASLSMGRGMRHVGS